MSYDKYFENIYFKQLQNDKTKYLNTKSIWLKYFLIVFGGGGGNLHHVSVLTFLLVKSIFF